MAETGQKGRDRENLKWVFGRLRQFRVKTLLIAASFLAITALSFVQPLILRAITDDGMVNKDMGVIIRASLLLLALVTAGQGVELVQTKLFLRLRNQTQYQLFEEVFRRLLRLRPSYFEEHNATEIMNTLNSDVMNVSGVADRSVMFLFSYILRMGSGLLGLFVISWKLALLVLAVVPVKYLMVRVLAARRRVLAEQVMEQIRDFSGWFGDTLNGIREVKLWNLYGKKLTAFREKQEQMISRDEAMGMNDALNMVAEILLEWGLTAALYICGGLLLVRGELTLGSVFSFLSYSSYVTGPVSAIFNMKMLFARILPAAGRLREFLGLEVEDGTEVCCLGAGMDAVGSAYAGPAGRAAGLPGVQELRMSGIHFSYGGREVLRGAELVARPGERVAVIGQNGSGKTTILNLLLRFLYPDSGEILLNGRRVEEWPLDEYRELLAVVSQDPYLFEATAEENIDLKGELAEGQIRAACEKSGAASFLKASGRLTGQNGAKLSGGEKQKLAIARAIAKGAPIILLDEANSGFDPESDRYLAQILKEGFRDRIVIMITHRYENLKDFDRVYRLEGGVLTEARQLQERRRRGWDEEA